MSINPISGQPFINRIRSEVKPGTVIPKPAAKANFIVKRWGKRRGQDALVYLIPNHSDPRKPHEKGVTESEFVQAYIRLQESGTFTREWFNSDMAPCATEGGCNFTTIGGVMMLLGEAGYAGRGLYVTAAGAPQ